MKRKQEKLKEQILKEAAEYKAKKAQRMAEAAEEMARLELKNHNEKAKPRSKFQTAEINSPGKNKQRPNAPTSPTYQPELSKEEEQKLAED